MNKNIFSQITRIISLVLCISFFITPIAKADELSREDLAQYIENYCSDVLDALCNIYYQYPEHFDEDYIELTYKYAQMWDLAELLRLSEKKIAIKEKNQILAKTEIGINRNLELVYIGTRSVLDLHWKSFLSNEISKEDFTYMLINYIEGKKTKSFDNFN